MVTATFAPEELAYQQFRGLCAGIKKLVIARRPKFDNTINADVLLALFHDLRRVNEELNLLKGTAGVGNFAKRVQNDPSFSLGDEATELFTLMAAVKSELKNLIPVSNDGTIAIRSWSPEDKYTFFQLSAVQMTNLRTALTNLVNAIQV